MHKLCRICFTVCKAIPLCVILCIIGWSYYAYVVAMCIHTIPAGNIGEKGNHTWFLAILILFFHIFLGVFLWTYAQASLASPIKPPREFELSPSDWSNLVEAGSTRQRRNEYLHGLVGQRGLPVFTRAGGNAIRICEDCRIIKPDRAHHCSTCGQCMLKMDHHCPWVNNCVGFHNYKFFVQFLLYGSLYCFYVGSTTAKYFVKFWTEGMINIQAFRFHLLFLFFAAWMFCIALVGLGAYHLYLTLLNQTTLESFRAPLFEFGPDKRAYSVGLGNNFAQVFGSDRLMWFLPMYSSKGSGLVFPTRHEFSTARAKLLAEPDSDVEANRLM